MYLKGSENDGSTYIVSSTPGVVKAQVGTDARIECKVANLGSRSVIIIIKDIINMIKDFF